MPQLTTREKIAHLLRRFGMGASKAELDMLEPRGIEGALDWLIDYEAHDEGFPVDPWEICFEEGKTEVYVDPFRFASVWGIRMVLSQRPLEQKLALFWHDHFAVSGAKVEFGPPMWSYLETLRTSALDFPTLLKRISFEPAMLRFLDGDTSLAGHPNENFARELLELFTLGQGNYIEQDIKEVARAFTGWGVRYLIFESGGEQAQQRIRDAIITKSPMIAASFSPALHDPTPIKFLGTSASSPDEVLDKLAMMPRTAEYVSAKLWDYFAAVPASTATRNMLAKTFLESKGAIKPVLRAIANSDEFWSDKCIRHRVKSPADFIVPIARQLGVNAFLLMANGKPTGKRPLPKPLRDVAGLIIGTMYQQGMLLLFPPDVGGWEWGEAWITPSNMLNRMNVAAMLCGVGQADKGLAGHMGNLIRSTNPGDSLAAADSLCTLFNAELSLEKKKVLAAAFDRGGGIAGLGSPEGASKALAEPMKLLFGSPEFQMC